MPRQTQAQGQDRLYVAADLRKSIGAKPWPNSYTSPWRPCASRIPNSLAESRIEAPLRGAWRLAYDNEVRSHASLKGHTLLTFAGGHMGGPCRAEQCPFGLPLPGLGPAPSGGLTTNSRRTGAARVEQSVRSVDMGRCCMNTLCRWGGVARTSLDPPQEPHYGNEVEGSSHV